MTIEELIAYRDSLPDPDDLPNLSPRERLRRQEERAAVDRRLADVRAAEPLIAKRTPKIEGVRAWLAHVGAWREEFEAERIKLPAPDRRTPEQTRRGLQLDTAIRNIDYGCEYDSGIARLSPLLAEKIKAAYVPSWDGPRDPWAVGFGSIVNAQDMLADWEKQVGEAQSRLDAALREPVPTTV